MATNANDMVDIAIFEHLQQKIDEDAKIREELRGKLQDLEKQGRITQSILSRAHSTPTSQLQSIISEAEDSINGQISTIGELSKIASCVPYYKYNGTWTRDIQDAVFAAILCGWLGGFSRGQYDRSRGKLLTIEEVGNILHVPVNLKDQDAFHLTIEEYLHALISLVEELARLAVNSVTLGDYERPMQISKFVRNLHAGFQILNLKNDSLRRRSDGIKYNVKKVEDVVYDLSLRRLVPSVEAGASQS